MKFPFVRVLVNNYIIISYYAQRNIVKHEILMYNLVKNEKWNNLIFFA